MPRVSPFLKPFLRLLELLLVAFIIYKVVSYSIEVEQASLPQDWRSQIGTGFAQTILGFIVLLIYFVIWNVRIIKAISRESQQKVKYLNIGLLCLFPGLFAMTLIYWQFQKELVKNKAGKYLVPVAYREVYHTPDSLTGIRGFRPASDSVLILTSKVKVAGNPPKIYRNGKAVPDPNLSLELVENSEELFSLKNGQLKRLAVQHDYTQFREYYFKGWAKCMQAFINRQKEENIYRFDNCTQQHLLEPALTGYQPSFRGSTVNYEVGRELFFLTAPLHADFRADNYFYVGRITDSEAKVYRLDLDKNPELVKELKHTLSNVQIFATTRNIYLVSRSRILEINI